MKRIETASDITPGVEWAVAEGRLHVKPATSRVFEFRQLSGAVTVDGETLALDGAGSAPCVAPADLEGDRGYVVEFELAAGRLLWRWNVRELGGRLYLNATETRPFDAHAEAGMKDMLRFSDPVPGWTEMCYLHTVAADEAGQARAAFVNAELGDGLGLYLRFDARELPYMTEWKMMGQGDYVVGVEPCNVPIPNRAELREQGLEPHRVKEVFVASTAEANTWIDITDTIDKKIEALRQHASQFPDGWDPEELLRGWASETGEKVGVLYAEAYRRIVLVREDED